MSAYLLVRVKVTDWDKYKEYMKVTPGVIEQYGGRFIVRGGDVETLEGPPETYRVVVVEFPSVGFGPVHVKIHEPSIQQIDLVDQQRFGLGKDDGILGRLVVAFRHREHDDLTAFPKFKC